MQWISTTYIIEETQTPVPCRTSQDHNPNDEMDWLYFPIPYVSNSVDCKIKTKFKNEGISVRTTHKLMTLRQALKPRMQETRWLQPTKLRDFQQPPLLY